MGIVSVIIAGVVIGALGKWLIPGDKDNTPLWLTILCGIVGGLIGWILYAAFEGSTSLEDWACWTVVLVCAAIPVLVAATLTGRNKVNIPR